jgi:hypothetical protein
VIVSVTKTTLIDTPLASLLDTQVCIESALIKGKADVNQVAI